MNNTHFSTHTKRQHRVISFAFQMILQSSGWSMSGWHRKRTWVSCGNERSSSAYEQSCPAATAGPSLAPWNITYYSSLMSCCLSHGDEWMLWQLMEEENKRKATRWRWHPAPTTYISNIFPPFGSLRLPVILNSAWHIVLSYILYRCFGELSLALCIPISCLMEKGRRLPSHPFQLFTLTSHQLLWKATAEVCPLLFVNVLFASAGGSQLLSRAEKKRNLTSFSVFFLF